MGTQLRALSESYLMNTNTTGLDGFQESYILFLWMKVPSALEGLILMLLVANLTNTK